MKSEELIGHSSLFTLHSSLPLAELRVLELGSGIAGAFCGKLLAAFGAEVTLVEPPAGAACRRLGPFAGDRPSTEGSLPFLYLNTGKLSVTLEPEWATGRALLRRLVAGADVLVENYRPGAFEALGLGYEALSAINPRLIYCSISAFGRGGPRGHQTGYDNILQASSGMMAMTGTKEAAPLKTGAPVVDYATGTTGAFAIATALFHRERTGRGQHIDLSMLDVALVLSSSHVAAHGWNGAHPEPHGNRFPFATIGCYQAKDAALMISASNLRQQRRLWTALGRPEMIKRNNGQRLDAHAEEAAALAEIIATRTADEWETFLQANRVPASRVRRMEEALADPQIATRAVVHRHDPAPGLDGPLTVPVAAFRLRHGGPSVDTAPRQVGADTDAVLREIGYSEQDIAALRTAGDI